MTTYYAYDRCGNTKSKQGPEGTTGYHWDHENRLTQIDQPGDVHSYFGYDADGKRVTKEDSEGFTRFIYQGADMLALMQERDEEGSVTAHYTIGDGLEAMRRGDDSRFYHYDWLGSTFELTDGDGAVTDSYLYDACGNALATTGATPNPHRYVGRERYYFDRFANLHQLGVRWYRGALASFLSLDPAIYGRVGTLHAANGYPYCDALPTAYSDPTGEAKKKPGDVRFIWPGMPISDEIHWLDTTGKTLPMGSRQRLDHIELLLEDLTDYGKLKYDQSPRMIERWMSGKGDFTVSFDLLLSDPGFRDAYNVLTLRLADKCCIKGSAQDRELGRFQRGDLYLSFNWWNWFGGSAKSSKTGSRCRVAGIGWGEEERVGMDLSFGDKYDWHVGEGGPFYLYGQIGYLGTVKQAWFVEYLTYSTRLHRRNRDGGPPRDFRTRAYRNPTRHVCCVAGHAYDRYILG